jgi:isochorismate pyruvate lyase
MADIRSEIDRLDDELVPLFAARAACIDRAGKLKARLGLPARITPRVQEVVTNMRRHAVAQGLPPELVEKLWRRLIERSIARGESVLGPDSLRGEK